MGKTLDEDNPPPEAAEAPEGTMTLDHMDEIVRRLDENAVREGGMWNFKVADVPVMIVTDEKNDRMRVMVAIRKAGELDSAELMRLLQADFDSALDARYAVAHEILWSAYIHPLAALYDRQFISAIGQTVNLALTYGTSYTSGALVFGGGDSQQLLRRKLIDDLQEKGRKA
ncbi:MAG: hypothetical protein CVT83_09045 [Alphaproteobacteria bacterium HGW-Alphaproteobacteria-5]|nr:MAG: hypothetical protein CVT83_09045 [Alphaproteobacteria bacterium HGW-Alphaproteobacteria-5]